MNKKEGGPAEPKKNLRAQLQELKDAGKDVGFVENSNEYIITYGSREFHFGKVYYTEAKIADLLEKNGIEDLIKIDRSDFGNLK